MSNTPQIRFAGFTDAWEQRKLENITSLITKGTTPKDKSGNGEVNFIKVENIDPSSGIISSCSRISLEEHEGYLKRSQLKENDILFSIAGTLGRTSVVNKGILPANTNQALAILRVSEGDISYLVTVLSGRAVSDFIKKNPTVGAQPNLSLEQVSNLEIPYPSIEEQQKIGDYFRNLDDLITLHQRKCDALQKFKKSMLQKMFPQNGESVPEIRFAGFTDAWEQRKFSDFTFPAGERNKDDLDLEPYAITNNQGFIAQSEAHDDFGYMKDVDRKMYIVVKPNSFAYNPARINVGSLGYYEGAENVIVSSLYEVFQTAEYVDDKFLKHWFKTKAFQDWIERLQEGSVRLYFYYDKLCECVMSMPSVEEQRKIGAYLDKLDNLITLHQRKLETLQKMKKSLLQKMFV